MTQWTTKWKRRMDTCISLSLHNKKETHEATSLVSTILWYQWRRLFVTQRAMERRIDIYIYIYFSLLGGNQHYIHTCTVHIVCVCVCMCIHTYIQTKEAGGGSRHFPIIETKHKHTHLFFCSFPPFSFVQQLSRKSSFVFFPFLPNKGRRKTTTTTTTTG